MKMAVVQAHHAGDHTDGEIRSCPCEPPDKAQHFTPESQVSHLHADDIMKIKATG